MVCLRKSALKETGKSASHMSPLGFPVPLPLGSFAAGGKGAATVATNITRPIPNRFICPSRGIWSAEALIGSRSGHAWRRHAAARMTCQLNWAVCSHAGQSRKSSRKGTLDAPTLLRRLSHLGLSFCSPGRSVGSWVALFPAPKSGEQG